MRKKILLSTLLTLLMLMISSATVFADTADVVTASQAKILLVQAKTSGKKGVKLSWNNIPGATKYVVYGNSSGKKFKKIAKIKKKSYKVSKIKGKKLKANRVYKFYVAAYKGKKRIVKSSPIYFITSGTKGKYGNVSKLDISLDNAYLKSGESLQLNTSTVVVKSKAHIPSSYGAAIRYYSTNKDVVTVDKNGFLTAKAEGKARVYAQDIGGKYDTVLVEVEKSSRGGAGSDYKPLCFTAKANRSSVSMVGIHGEDPGQLVYSTDGRNWKPFVIDETVVPLNHINQSVYFRAADSNDVLNANFVMNGRIEASNNVMSLLDADCESKTISTERALSSLFENCTSLIHAPEMPATTLAPYCYERMFAGCTGLSYMPELPATTMKDSCYLLMFSGCDYINNVSLPAMELAPACYSYMFYNCDSVAFNGADPLPATDLAESCYLCMFLDCNEISNAPTTLPATELPNYCYKDMFNGCKSVEIAPTMNISVIGNSSCEGMFQNCTQLTDATAISFKNGDIGIDMNTKSCKNMFANCSSLKKQPAMDIAKTGKSCFERMFYGCSALTDASLLNAKELQDSCYKEMFRDCTSLKSIEGMDAESVAASSCKAMFRGCTSLTVAPVLKAENFAIDCYSEMFCQCSNLKTIRVKFIDPENDHLTYAYRWVLGVSDSGQFYCPEGTPSEYGYIPEGWRRIAE